MTPQAIRAAGRVVAALMLMAAGLYVAFTGATEGTIAIGGAMVIFGLLSLDERP